MENMHLLFLLLPFLFVLLLKNVEAVDKVVRTFNGEILPGFAADSKDEYMVTLLYTTASGHKGESAHVMTKKDFSIQLHLDDPQHLVEPEGCSNEKCHEHNTVAGKVVGFVKSIPERVKSMVIGETSNEHEDFAEKHQGIFELEVVIRKQLSTGRWIERKWTLLRPDFTHSYQFHIGLLEGGKFSLRGQLILPYNQFDPKDAIIVKNDAGKWFLGKSRPKYSYFDPKDEIIVTNDAGNVIFKHTVLDALTNMMEHKSEVWTASKGPQIIRFLLPLDLADFIHQNPAGPQIKVVIVKKNRQPHVHGEGELRDAKLVAYPNGQFALRGEFVPPANINNTSGDNVALVGDDDQILGFTRYAPLNDMQMVDIPLDDVEETKQLLKEKEEKEEKANFKLKFSTHNDLFANNAQFSPITFYIQDPVFSEFGIGSEHYNFEYTFDMSKPPKTHYGYDEISKKFVKNNRMGNLFVDKQEQLAKEKILNKYIDKIYHNGNFHWDAFMYSADYKLRMRFWQSKIETVRVGVKGDGGH